MANHYQGPRWAPAKMMASLVPDIVHVLPENSPSRASDWLSREAMAERVTRRQRNPLAEYVGKGRPPLYEYNVASVRRRVRELMTR